MAGNIVEELQKEPEMSGFLEMAQGTSFTEQLETGGPFTIFAPINDAFQRLNPGLVHAMNKDKAIFKKALLNHIVSKAHNIGDLKNDETFVTESDHAVRTNKLTVDGVEDEITSVNGKWIVQSIEADNGVVHMVNGFLFPPNEYSIGDVVQKQGEVSKLLEVVEIAGLMENLSDGPYTLFAPSNEALGKLSVKEMSKKDATQLVYKHLVPGTYFQPALSNGRLTAVSGSKLFTKATGNKIAIVCQDDMAEAMIQEANLPVTNGVIHIIDRVL